MTKILASLALIALSATVISMQPARSEGAAPVFRSYAQYPQQTLPTTTKRKPVTTTRSRPASPYSTNPEYDVYVRGEYVGSDPDPRIRATIRKEATRDYGLR